MGPSMQKQWPKHPNNLRAPLNMAVEIDQTKNTSQVEVIQLSCQHQSSLGYATEYLSTSR